MILSGREIVTRGIVRNLRHIPHQQQPCGVDLTLRKIYKWTCAATIDFDNTHRRAAKTLPLAFDTTSSPSPPVIKLPQGAYLIDFSETVRIPRDCVGSLFTRSSLWRSGVRIEAGVVDAGYEGALGALLIVRNEEGVVFHEGAKLAQIVIREVKGGDEGEVGEGEREREVYKGIYQGAGSSVGRDGAGVREV